MFRSRTSAQKPGDDLLADFRQQFPEVSTVNTEPLAPAISQATVAVDNPLLNSAVPERIHHPNGQTFQDLDPTPRASNDPWRFTPSLLDPGAFGFHSFVPNAASAYYPPTPGGMGSLVPPPPPALAMTTGLETPMSGPTTANAIQPSVDLPEIPNFQALEPNQLHPFNSYVHEVPVIIPPAVPLIAPPFMRHDADYEAMDNDCSPMDSENSEDRLPAAAITTLHRQPVTAAQISHTLPPAAEKFRFLSALNAPTAMVKHPDEIPVTYLNKGQAYSLSIIDTDSPCPASAGTRYRTYVRISFEDEQQRRKPSVCWSLWKEGRGTNEAHQRGGKLQAVEYVEAGQPIDCADRRTRVELESSSFDGFSVVWTPGATGAAELILAVRFNFLSTDFSHSKGVKGIPVRLCAKTQMLPADEGQNDVDATPEICYCKVKLFRDHGAERKLSNDVAHVKKSVEKIKQQIDQAGNGHKDLKRKRASGIIKIPDAQRVAKAQRHRRTWSMSSASSASGGPRLSMEEDMQFKLQSLQDMFTSTRPVSVLYLRGEDLDDPDLHPVSLNGDSLAIRDFLRDGTNWHSRSTRSSIADSLVSPSPSSLSLASQASAVGSNTHWPNPDSAGGQCHHGDGQSKIEQQLTTVEKRDCDGTLSGWIEALGVDPSYRPRPQQSPKPAACLYLIRRGDGDLGGRQLHRAVYLAKRTLADLNDRIAAKWGLDASRITRTTHLTTSGIEIEVDDDVVQELREGQDMELQIEEVAEQPTIKEEWDMVLDDEGDGHGHGSDSARCMDARQPSTTAHGVCLKLIF